jgi:hypothetical protein
MELASICRRAHTELEGTAILSRSRGRDRWFESTFLQRGVSCEPEFLDHGADGRKLVDAASYPWRNPLLMSLVRPESVARSRSKGVLEAMFFF